MYFLSIVKNVLFTFFTLFVLNPLNPSVLIKCITLKLFKPQSKPLIKKGENL